MRKQILEQIATALKERNPEDFFIREADIQLYLAKYLIDKKIFDRIFIEYHIPRKLIPDYPWSGNKIYVDIVIEHKGYFYPIEIKYKTIKQEFQHFVFGQEDTKILLGQHGAQDIGCYDFWKDVKRVELFEDTFPKCERGIVLFVSNDDTYRKKPLNPDAGYAKFSIHEGQHVLAKSTLDWNGNFAVAKGRPALEITNDYIISWTPLRIDKHYYILV